MASRYSRISAPWWEEVWIVAGGRSARRFDLDRLSGKTVLAVNDAVDILPGAIRPAAAVFSLDNRWIRRRRDFLSRFPGEKFLAVPLETWPDCAGIPGAVYLGWSHQNGLSENPGIIATGGNSGYGAVNVAYLKHAQVIHLVGYDMHPQDNEQFLHWAPRFRAMLPQFKQRGISVINHNPDSSIDAFPTVFSMGCPA